MRILSQNGMIDLPYERVGVSINHNDSTKIVAYPAGNYNKEFGSWKIAEYSTTEKAQKAMEMLRKAYCGVLYLKHGDYEVEDIDLMQELEKKIEETMKKPHFIEAKPNNAACECKIFQFPTDDEIEV